MLKRLLKIHLPEWTFPVILLILCVVSYGILIPRLGYYWDDWAKTLVNRIFGLGGYWDYYAGDRPTSGWTHIVFIKLIGDAPLAWHITVLVIRWLSAWGMWWSLSSLWRGAKRQSALATLVFVIYPVFSQQSIAVTFHQQWMQYALFFLSLGCMIHAFRNPHRSLILSLVGLIALALQVTITEYFAPLEFVRPLVLFILADQVLSGAGFKQKALKIMRHWLPYLVLLAAYLIWRLFLLKLPNDDPYKPQLLFALFTEPVKTIIQFLKVSGLDTMYILIASWADVLKIGLGESVPPFTILSWGMAILVAAGLFSYFQFFRPETEDDDPSLGGRWIRQALLLGMLALILGCVPAWISGRKVIHDFHSNRYALPALFGASLVFTSLVEWFSQQRAQKVLMVCIAIGLAVGFHLRTGNEYRWLWQDQTRFYWQLSWRAPFIEQETAIMSEMEMFPNQGLFSTSAALNLLYPQRKNPETLAYWAYTLLPKYDAGPPKPLRVSFDTRFRTLAFKGNSPNTLLVFNDPTKGNCLWVLNPLDVDSPYLPTLTRQMIALSNLERISPQSAAEGYPPEELYGKEPERGWCYLYEKADLARQLYDWITVAELGSSALAQGFTPDQNPSNSPHEWVPFIEGFAHTGDWDTAEDLTLVSYAQDRRYQKMLCILWQRIAEQAEASAVRDSMAATIFDQLNCSMPGK